MKDLIEVILIALAIYAGHRLNWIEERIKAIEADYKKRREQARKTPEEKEAEKSTLLDPDDPVQAARLEHEETMKRLNPHLYEDNDLQ